MQVKMANIDTLKAHPMNPRVHPESAIDKLECSIKEFGRIMDWQKCDFSATTFNGKWFILYTEEYVY